MSSVGAEFDTGGLNSALRDAIAKLTGPEMASFLTPILTKAFGSALTNSVGMPGSSGRYTGPATMFVNPTMVDQQFTSYLHKSALDSAMRASQSVANDTRQRVRDAMSNMFFGAPAPTGISASNILSDMFIYSSLEIPQLQAGLQEAGRYYGVTSPLFAGNNAKATEDILRRTRNFSAASAYITDVYQKNASAFGGLSGKEVGQVTAEMARVGGFANLDITQSVQQVGDLANLSSENQAKLAALGVRLKEFTKTVSMFKDILKTDVFGAIDGLNNLFGVNAMASVGSTNLQKYGQNLYATAMLGGFTTSQVMGLSDASAQFSKAAGLHTYGAAASGLLSAQLLTGSRRISTLDQDALAFVDERRFRETMVNRVTGAQQSALARDMSGAAAILQQSGLDPNTVLDSLSGEFNVGDVLRVTNAALAGKGAGRVSAFDLQSASVTTEARRYIANGGATEQVLGNNVGFAQGIRKETLRKVMTAAGQGDQFAAVMRKLEGTAFSSADIRAALAGVAGGRDIANREAFLFERNAAALGLGGTLQEADLFLKTAADKESLRNLQQQVGTVSNLQGFMSPEGGSIGGIRALTEMQNVAKLTGPNRDTTLRAVLGVVTGRTDMDKTKFTDAMLKSVFGTGDRDPASLVTFLEDYGKAEQDVTKGAQGRFAAASVMSSLLTGTVGNRAATEEEVAMAKELFTAETPEKRREIMEKFQASAISGAGIESTMYEAKKNLLRAQTEERLTKNKGKFTSTHEKAIQDLVFMQQFADGGDLVTIKDADKEAQFKKRAAELAAAAEKGLQTGDMTEYQKLAADSADIFRQGEAEAAANDKIFGAQSTDSLQNIESMLRTILERFMN